MKRISFLFFFFSMVFFSCILPTENNNMNNNLSRESLFSDTLNGKAVQLYTLKNKQGMSVEFSNYGATVLSINVPDRDGKVENVVLGYDNIGGYYAGKSYFGSIVGRFANRIANGKFTIDGVEYTAPLNNGKNTLHGGVNSIDKQVWNAKQNDSSIAFSIIIPDGENGYPGEVNLTVTYTLNENNEIVIDYNATTTKTTILNVSNHTYFNLTGDPSRTILEHMLQLYASRFTPVDSTLIPTGELKEVSNTAFDFTTTKQIGRDIEMNEEQIILGKGYDHNFVLNESTESIKPVAIVDEMSSGRRMEVYTTQPGVQFYSGNFLDGSHQGRGTSFQIRSGFCLETQFFPDSPNKPNFPSTILKPGETFTSKTIYRFSTFK
jgi:aldose 1-epimerase